MPSAAPSGPPRRLEAGVDYPGNLMQFLDWFQTEADCWNYLVRLRWPDGFRCSRCGGRSAWLTSRRLFVCSACRHQTSATAGTIFENTRVSLLTWFRAAWFMTSQKRGASAASLKTDLGLGSYKTAWMIEHKLRTAMVSRDRSKLSGEIEVDETFVGGRQKGGTRGRGTASPETTEIAKKRMVVIAVEKPTGHVQYGLGRVRMRMIPRGNAEHLGNFVSDVCEPGSIIYTDGLASYNCLPGLGFTHIATVHSDTTDPEWVAMSGVHRIASLLKRWLLGTHQGGVAANHLDYYLDEFTFRFNRRRSRSRGLLFYRLMELAVQTRTIEYETLVWSRRDVPGVKRRGRERTRPPRPRRGRRTRPSGITD